MDEPTTASEILARSELFALLVVAVGIVVARLASVGVGSLLGILERRAARLSTSEHALVSPATVRISRTLVFWIVLILAVTLALRLLGAGGVSTLFDQILEFVPRLLIAFSIVLAGHLLGLAAAHLAARFHDQPSTASAWPRVAYGAVVTVAVVVGIQQIDIDISFLTQALLIVIATVSAGLMLAFGLGARQHVANLMARRDLARLSVGTRIRVDDIEGVIVEIYDTGVDVSTETGVRSIPGARIAERGVLRLAERDADA